ncbi:MAG: ATP-binding protein [Chloroflexi bacterium]|nr:ATP-binding protein [Chloroflexota bacterium]
MAPMYRSLLSIKSSLTRAVSLFRNRDGRAIAHKRRQSFDEVQRLSDQGQEIPDPSSIGRTLVSAIARCIETERVVLFLPQPDQDKLVIAASEGVDDLYPMQLQSRSPFLIWLEEQHRVVAAEEIYPLPQWQGIPLAEQEALSALHCKLFVSIRTEGLLVMGRRKGGNTYNCEEMETIGLLAHQASAVMEIAHLRHQLEQQRHELDQARRHLTKSTRMAAIEEAVSASAREIESSLQTLSALMHEMDGQAASQQSMDTLKAEIVHANDALLPLLDLLKERQSNESIHNLNSIISSVVSANGLDTSGSKIKLTLLLDPGEPHIWCNGEQIRQVFVNLVANALDAMSKEGFLDISTRAEEDRVEIKLTDTGVGIPREQLERVFDPFFTTKPDGKGSGVGLASSRRTVEQHEGTITLDSQVGKGTTVTIVLPVRPAQESILNS